ncbi:MAG: IclR family transcriptional regulator [Granulosicoccus sp.]
MQSSIIEKLLALLTLISQSSKPATFTELVDVSGMNKSTMHRLLSLGLENQLLQYDNTSKTYLLGPKLFDLVRSAYRGYDIQNVALAEMLRLQKLVKENITIGVPLGSETVYLRLLEATSSVGPMPLPGMREQFHCSASGKAWVAFLPNTLIEATLEAHTFERYTDNTITTARKFHKALLQVREQGYGTNDREEYDHLVGISAPIFNYLAEPIAVLNIWTSHRRYPIEKLIAWADELKDSTHRVTELIGGVQPTSESLKQ